MFLQSAINSIENSLPHYKKVNAKVSQKSVGWQLDHTLRVIIGVSKVLATSNPEDYQWKFNKTRFVIFLLNKIPRGKGRAPKQVVNSEEVTIDELQSLIEKAKEGLQVMENLPEKANFNHPYFGMLNLKQTKRFMKIHTQHHLNIVKDILD